MLFVLFSAFILGAFAASPTVQISAGLVKGAVCQNNQNTAYFKSIPYAEAPIGDLRFKGPRPWSGYFPVSGLNATLPSSPCIQFGPGAPESPLSSEDCLHLNVWAPANATKNSKLPVRVFAHGGFNRFDSKDNPLYDGCMVPSTGAIMVSMNYRLGPLGFLTKPDAGIRGNQGIQDIILALQWIQANIAAFGGDNQAVMLSGESAGAEDAFIISSIPSASGLFRSAIFESTPLFDLLSLETAGELGSSYLDNLNCTSINTISCLQNASILELQAAYNTLPLLNDRKFTLLTVPNITSADAGFQPCVDGNLIVEQPLKTGSKVPAIFGTNSMEGTLFALATFSNGFANVTEDVYDQYLQENFGALADDILKYYPWSAFQSTPYPGFYAISTIFKQALFFCPTYLALKATITSGLPAWTYLFSRGPSCPWVQGITANELPLLGATHTSELEFVFGNTGGLPNPDGTCELSAAEIGISNFMLQSWTAMAKAGNPSTDWPIFDNRSLGINFINQSIPGLVDYTACNLWNKILETKPPCSGERHKQ